MSSATLSCSCRHTVPGLSPSAHTGDGTTDLIIVRSSVFSNLFILEYFQVHNTFHLNCLRYLFRTAFNMSHPFRLPFVQAVRVKSWSFTPQANKQTEDHIGPHSFHLTGWWNAIYLELWWRSSEKCQNICQKPQTACASICKVNHFVWSVGLMTYFIFSGGFLTRYIKLRGNCWKKLNCLMTFLFYSLCT